ncbi:hypothetical protein KIN20_001137 [Parelaphostrongylus tenuis]|uniref:Uncharacterized protein n=1 Tax=Parelaphostrongylus tenuis TaxID=148309 RepID=A0AAD5MCF1_PARTN|nr:hypothetical protein KIN20_001137 [Parelaphostrongylus tenuis]
MAPSNAHSKYGRKKSLVSWKQEKRSEAVTYVIGHQRRCPTQQTWANNRVKSAGGSPFIHS